MHHADSGARRRGASASLAGARASMTTAGRAGFHGLAGSVERLDVTTMKMPEVAREVLDRFPLLYAQPDEEGNESGGWACPAPKRRTARPARWPLRSAGTSSGC